MVNPSGGSARRGAELALALIFISRRSSCERFVIRALGVISCHHVRRVWADGKAYRLQKVIIPANLNLLHHTPRGSNEGQRGTMTDGRRGSATYWRDRAAATEKPSRGRDQGRKVSPKRDQSGKPAKRDRRRREAGLFTL